MAGELTAQEAQKIADGIMQIIPHNINIMDSYGYIIASGDESRLGTLHMGAVHALSTLEPHIIRADTFNERRGVNLPIIYNDKVVGVIGISGEVEQVLPIAQIVLVTAKLMLENQEYNNVVLLKNAHLRDYLFEWANYEKREYSQAFIDRGKALEVDITLPYAAVLFRDDSHDDNELSDTEISLDILLNKDDFVIWSRRRELLMAMRDTKDLSKRAAAISRRYPNYTNVYVGESGVNLATSILRARQTYKLAKRIGLKNPVVLYDHVYLDQALLSAELPRSSAQVYKRLVEADVNGELRDTIYVYMNKTHDIAGICESLHVHRNTLNYRLARIQELTGKNPRCGHDLVELYLAVLQGSPEIGKNELT